MARILNRYMHCEKNERRGNWLIYKNGVNSLMQKEMWYVLDNA